MWSINDQTHQEKQRSRDHIRNMSATNNDSLVYMYIILKVIAVAIKFIKLLYFTSLIHVHVPTCSKRTVNNYVINNPCTNRETRVFLHANFDWSFCTKSARVSAYIIFTYYVYFNFVSFLPFSYWILEMVRKCGIFFSLFHCWFENNGTICFTTVTVKYGFGHHYREHY